ncbi:MAG: hypothetical protein RLZZ419_2030 [Pseudomonadota bacterium]
MPAKVLLYHGHGPFLQKSIKVVTLQSRATIGRLNLLIALWIFGLPVPGISYHIIQGFFYFPVKFF